MLHSLDNILFNTLFGISIVIFSIVPFAFIIIGVTNVINGGHIALNILMMVICTMLLVLGISRCSHYAKKQ